LGAAAGLVPGCEFSDNVRRSLRPRLTSHRCSADDIAGLLTMHWRTLSRRLRGSGIGYRAITNETRFEIARMKSGMTRTVLADWARSLPAK
jgi:hypothetical protein